MYLFKKEREEIFTRWGFFSFFFFRYLFIYFILGVWKKPELFQQRLWTLTNIFVLPPLMVLQHPFTELFIMTNQAGSSTNSKGKSKRYTKEQNSSFSCCYPTGNLQNFFVYVLPLSSKERGFCTSFLRTLLMITSVFGSLKKGVNFHGVNVKESFSLSYCWVSRYTFENRGQINRIMQFPARAGTNTAAWRGCQISVFCWSAF